MDVIVFKIDSQEFAIELALIERVIRIVLFTKQPNAETSIAGIINLHGDVIPVIDFRSLIGLKEKEVDLGDQLIICLIASKKIALWIDSVKQIASFGPDQISQSIHSVSKDDSLEWMIKEGQQVILYYNLTNLLTAKTALFSSIAMRG